MKEKELIRYQNSYSEKSFWGKLKKVAAKAGAKVIYLALILYYELKDPTVSIEDKGIIIGALGYFILPIDLIPDAIPVAGFTDDAAALAAAYGYIRKHLTPEVINRAQNKLVEILGNVDFKEISPK